MAETTQETVLRLTRELARWAAQLPPHAGDGVHLQSRVERLLRAIRDGGPDMTSIQRQAGALDFALRNGRIGAEYRDPVTRVIALARAVVDGEGVDRLEGIGTDDADAIAALTRLRELRDLDGLSATRIAEDLLVVGDRTIRRWLAGDGPVSDPGASWLARADILAVTPDDVILRVRRKRS